MKLPRDDVAALLGATVTIGKDWHGEIDAISIRRSGAILYEVVWWDGSKRNSEYVAREEFTLRQKEAQ